MNNPQLRTVAEISSNAMAQLGQDKSISIKMLYRICNVLQYDIKDITEVIPEEDCNE